MPLFYGFEFMAYRKPKIIFICPDDHCNKTFGSKRGMSSHLNTYHDLEYKSDEIVSIKEEVRVKQTSFETVKGDEKMVEKLEKKEDKKEEKQAVDKCPECSTPLYGNEYKCPTVSCGIRLNWDEE